jgi:hypothetical protein
MLLSLDHLSIVKRDADCYDVVHGQRNFKPASSERQVYEGRVAAIRADFTEDAQRVRTMVPGTWRIRWEHQYEGEGRSALDVPQAVLDLRFQTAHEAFAFYCSQVLV